MKQRDIAIIIEFCLILKNISKISNYKIYRQDGPPTLLNKLRDEVLIEVPTEDILQSATCNIEIQ